MNDKVKFLSDCTVIVDTREQKNTHIINELSRLNVKYISRKLPYGDYSFICNDTDFSLLCVVERKANINELWQNITSERERFEAEISRTYQMNHSPILMIENCPDRAFIEGFCVPDAVMAKQGRKVQDIGKIIISTLDSWSSSNRYALRTEYVPKQEQAAAVLLRIFYYYWRNYQKLLKPIRKDVEHGE